MPTPPMALSTTATASRSQATPESVAAALAVLEFNEVTTTDPAFPESGRSTARAHDPFPAMAMDPIKFFDVQSACGP
jgi:hypothetical protein